MSALHKLVPLLVIPVTACAPGASSLDDAGRKAIADEVTAVMADMTEAMNAHDPERVVAFYTDAAEFLFLGCTQFISGGATFKAMVGPTYGPRRGATFTQRVASVRVLSPTAAVVTQVGGSDRAPALFWTKVLVKEEGRWIITYEHQSWPGCEAPPEPHPATTASDSIGLQPGGSD